MILDAVAPNAVTSILLFVGGVVSAWLLLTKIPE